MVDAKGIAFEKVTDGNKLRVFSRDGENALSPYCAKERRLEWQAVARPGNSGGTGQDSWIGGWWSGQVNGATYV